MKLFSTASLLFLIHTLAGTSLAAIGDACSSSSGSGTCRETSSCSGTTIAGACPRDPSDVKCCIKSLAPAAGDIGESVLAAAKTQEGVPYSYGGGGCSGKSKGIEQGANTIGFDCSGLTQFAVCQATGKSTILPRTTKAQYAGGTRVARANAKIGDLLFWATGSDCSCSGGYCPKVYHTAIWAGSNKIFEAQKTGTNVGLHPMRIAEVCPYVVRYW